MNFKNLKSDITTEIKNIIDTIPGWSSPEELLCLYTLGLANGAKGGDIHKLVLGVVDLQ